MNSSKPMKTIALQMVVPNLQVCELDIIFNFEKAYFMLDELLIGGEVQETSKKNVLKAIAAQDLLQEVGQDLTCDHLLQFLSFLGGDTARIF